MLRAMNEHTHAYDANLVYDIGMHRGEDTDYYLKKGFKVVAFEANPELVAACKDMFSERIRGGDLVIIEGAIAPAAYGHRMTFYRNSRSIWGTVEPGWYERNLRLGNPSEIIEVDRVDFGEALCRFGVPLFMKIDIEGCDKTVLEALKKWGVRPKYISIESEKIDFLKLRDELSLLWDLGYRGFRAVQQKTVPGSSIVTRDLGGGELRYTFSDDASGPFGDDLAQPWETYDEVLETYRRIFRRYRWVGDRSLLRRMKGGWRLIDAAEWLVRRPLPGWYDTHATL